MYIHTHGTTGVLITTACVKKAINLFPNTCFNLFHL